MFIVVIKSEEFDVIFLSNFIDGTDIIFWKK